MMDNVEFTTLINKLISLDQDVAQRHVWQLIKEDKISFKQFQKICLLVGL